MHARGAWIPSARAPEQANRRGEAFTKTIGYHLGSFTTTFTANRPCKILTSCSLDNPGAAIFASQMRTIPILAASPTQLKKQTDTRECVDLFPGLISSRLIAEPPWWGHCVVRHVSPLRHPYQDTPRGMFYKTIGAQTNN